MKKKEKIDLVHKDKTSIQEISQKIDLRNKYKLALKEISILEKRQEVIEVFNNYKPDIYKINKYKDDDNHSVAVALLSDIHCEERVDLQVVNYMNEYNPDICQKRLLDCYFPHILKLIEINKNGTKIDTLILALLGDLIQGYIHEEYQEDNYMSPTQASLFMYNILISGIEFLLKNSDLKKIIIPCCIGNHGRTTNKKRIATAYKNSYEWLLYNYLANYFKDEKRIEFIISNSYHIYMNIFDYTLRFHHGDAIRYGGGVGGISIPVNKALNEWNKAKKVNYDFFGHFHTPFDGGNFISNGSVVGMNAFSIEIKASYEEPKQMFSLISQKYGKTIVTPIFLK